MNTIVKHFVVTLAAGLLATVCLAGFATTAFAEQAPQQAISPSENEVAPEANGIAETPTAVAENEIVQEAAIPSSGGAMTASNDESESEPGAEPDPAVEAEEETAEIAQEAATTEGQQTKGEGEEALEAEAEEAQDESLEAEATTETEATAEVEEATGPTSTKAEALTTSSTKAKETVTAPVARKYATPFEAGVYYIQSSLSGQLMLDVSGGSKKSGANVQVYTMNKTEAQQWKLEHDEDGAYTIRSVGSGKYLDLSGGSARNGKNIWQYNGNGTAAQKWIITENGSGFTIASTVNKNFVLDVNGGRVKSGNNVQAYRTNNTPAQRWWIIAQQANPESEQIVEDGVYEILYTANSKYALDVSGANYKDGTNIQLWQRNNTVAQRWAITYETDGYYSIKNVSTTKSVDVSGAKQAAKTNIQSWSNNSSDAQRWAIQQNKNGSYSFVNKGSGLVLDISGAKAANGSNAHTYVANNTAAQQFTLKATDVLSEGTYNIYTMLAPTKQVVDVPDASTKAGTQEQLYSTNGTMAQKFYFRKTGSNTYRIQNVNSGMYLEDSAGKTAQQKRNAESEAQQWVASFENNGVVFTNVETGQRLATASNNSSNGTKVVTAKTAKNNGQHWRLTGTQLLSNACYTITNTNGKVLDLKSGSTANKANIQVYDSNNTAAQKFIVSLVSNGYYRIINYASGKAVEAASGSTADKANVQQYAYNGTAAQLWKPELTEDGAIIFMNKNSNKVLEAAGNASGSNVRQATASGATAQTWNLAVVNYSAMSGRVNLNVPCYYQNPELPTGCESVALTNCLRFYGFNLAKTTIADKYLTYSETDFVYSFMGNPYTNNGAAVMAPGLTNAGNRYLSAQGSNLRCKNITGTSLKNLYSYLANGTPAIVWNTMYFSNVGSAMGWSTNYTMYQNTHTVVLSGYDVNTNQVRISDSLSGKVWRDASRFESIYNTMGKQAIIIQ